jgi:hypothetical protein
MAKFKEGKIRQEGKNGGNVERERTERKEE